MRYDQYLTRFLYPAYRCTFDPLRRSRFLARRLFGVRCPVDSPYFFWDQVTLGLRAVLLRESLDGLAVCDMGCGPVAALSAVAARRGSRDITAVDIVPEFVDSAVAVLGDSGAHRAEVKLSDFDEKLGDATFDVVLFNSAYIPSSWGESQGINKDYPLETMSTAVTWSGGDDGTESICGFLERMPRHLSASGRIFLGFNRFYVGSGRVRDIAEDAGLIVADVHTWRLTSAVVMEIRA